MHAQQLLREGKPDAALAALQDEVKKAPGDAKLRVFLFQLLCVLGQWERSLKQLQVAASLDPAALPMAHTYRELIGCELFRAEVFSGKRLPSVLGEPKPWMALALRALELTAAGDPVQADALRAEAFELAPASAGTIDGQPFAWIADADSCLGPMLEIIARGRYYLLPFERIAALSLEAPTDLRDLVWTPATITLESGQDVVAFVPTRYAGTDKSADDALKLARKTEWQDVGSTGVVGLGQRTLATDTGEHALLDVRRIEFAPRAEGEPRSGEHA